jgi:dipeptidyl aminopeptidase/acylaminoacyl peptidase
MKKVFLILFLLLAVFLVLYFRNFNQKNVLSPISEQVAKIIEKPLEKYSFESLKKATFEPSNITIGKVLKEDNKFTSKMFYIQMKTSLKKNPQKVSGLINIPKTPGTYPVIVMFRGYVDEKVFTSGEGTRRTAEVLASNGFITVAPDFLGFGESDPYAKDQLEARFETYPTAITTLESIKNLNAALETATESAGIKADPEKIGIWGHSNGGHISLATLAITGKKYPTVLWNPVSKPFPYTIFFFMDELDDHGKALRKEIANFEELYDIEKFSPPNYYKWINAPIQLHQGAADESVPQKWSDELNEKLKSMDKDVEYFVYPGEDHNFLHGSYATVLQRTISFYKKEL